MNRQDSFREIRYREKHRKILENASRLFAAKGYDKASLEEIAAKLQLSKASLYHYFKSKEDLLFQVQMRGVEEAYAALREVVDSSLAPPEKIREAVRRHLRIITDERLFGDLGLREIALSDKMKSRIAAERERFEKIFQAIIEEGMVSGIFHRQDSRLAVSVIMGALHWIPLWYSRKGRFSIEEIADGTADIILRGLTVT